MYIAQKLYSLVHNSCIHVSLVLELLVFIEQLLRHILELAELSGPLSQFRVQMLSLLEEDVVSAL